MNQNQFKEFILKLSHDLAGQRRCFDLVNALIHENSPNLDDAKILLELISKMPVDLFA